MDKIKIIYIASNGRSGSTILDTLLGSFDKIWTLGEIHRIKFEYEFGNSDGSGKKYDESYFWKDLLNDILSIDKSSKNSLSKFREPDGLHSVLRKEYFNLILKRPHNKVEEIQEYSINNYKILKKILQKVKEFKPDTEYLVDASKDPYRLCFLLNSDLFDVRVIHLVKDPRANVYSFIRRIDDDVTNQLFRKSIRWTVENLIFSTICKNYAKHMTFLKYEEFASSPAKSIEKICNDIDLPLPNYSDNSLRGYTNYAVAGNSSRMSDSKIYLDEKWKNNLTEFKKNIIWGFTFPLAKKYGYS